MFSSPAIKHKPVIYPRRLYWGAYYDIHLPAGMPPWNMAAQDAYETELNKRATLIHWGQKWVGGDGRPSLFEASLYTATVLRGATPMINWNPWQVGSVNEPAFSLASIYRGDHDATILQWAQACGEWGWPVFVRMMDEMNGHWYPWAESQNGNQPGDFIKAWRHVVTLFRQIGASNAGFVFCPNEIVTNDPGYNTTPLVELYPGDKFVDWVGVDCYDWGYNPAKHYNENRSFVQVFEPTYRELQQIAPTKPVMVAEFGCTEWTAHGIDPSYKASWLADALGRIPTYYPGVHAVCYFNCNGAVADGMDWFIESSPRATQGFKKGISLPSYRAGIANS